MRVAFVGKGGAGKSVLAATTARLLARRGHQVLVIDSDPLPGLTVSLGMGEVDAALPAEVIEAVEEEGRRTYRLAVGLDPEQVIADHAVTGPEGVRVLAHGKMRGTHHPDWSTQAVLREVLGRLPAGGWTVVADLPGGTRQPYFGWASFVDRYLVVVEPSAKGLLAGRRLSRLRGLPGGPAVGAVLNKVDLARGDDPRRLGREVGLEVLATVPHAEDVIRAERRGRAVLDDAPGSEVVQALGSLIDALVDRPAAGEAS